MVVVGAIVGGCRRPTKDPAPVDALAGVDCKAVRVQSEPELMAWDGRAQLDRMRRRGVVAVRYETNGCEVSFELIPQCVGPKNKYVYAPFKATETRIARDANELFAQLPVGAANLSTLLKEKGKRALRTDLKLVGSVGLPPGSTVSEYDLVGPECKRATHIVQALYVGGFAMAAGDSDLVTNATNLFAAPPSAAPGAGGPESVAHEGHPAICDRAEAEGIELGGCSVPLRVALIPIQSSSGGARSVVSASPTAGGASSPAPTQAAGCTAARSDPSCALLPDGGRPPFDQGAIERVTRLHHTRVRRACWETTPETMKRVTVTVTTRIDTEGRAIHTAGQVTDADGPADVASVVARCVANDVRGWQFPEPESEKVLTLPFHLIRQ
jgi:hypothetical protein